MNEPEIEVLKQALRAGKVVIWNPEPTTGRIVKAIENRQDEPSAVATVGRGDYVALYNCDLAEFKQVVPL